MQSRRQDAHEQLKDVRLVEQGKFEQMGRTITMTKVTFQGKWSIFTKHYPKLAYT